MTYLGKGIYFYDNSSEYLKHHGIEGQKWGVRRGPPYPIDDTVLRKGYRLQSMTPYSDSEKYRKNEDKKWMYTSNNAYDNHIYNGKFANNRLLKSTKNPFKAAFGSVYSHNFETTKDLKMPTKAERKEEFLKLLKSNPKYMDDLKDGAALYQRRRPNASYKAKTLKIGDKLDEKDYDAAFEIFNGMIGYNREGWDITKDWSANMAKKWDAMVDDNDVRLFSGSKDPIIIFDPENSLKTTGPATRISARNRLNNNIAYEHQTRINKIQQKRNPNMYHSDIPTLCHSDTEDIDNFLCHYGTLGMKWGIHRAKKHERNMYRRNRANGMNKFKAKAYMKKNINWAKKYAKANKHTDVKISDISKHSYDRAKENISAYDRKLVDQGIRRGILVGAKPLKWYVATKNKPAAVGITAAQIGLGLYSRHRSKKDMKHSEESSMIPSLLHSDMNEIDDFLCHYGVKGQKWGVRHDREKVGFGTRRKKRSEMTISELRKDKRKNKKLPRTSLGLALKYRNMTEQEYQDAKRDIDRDREVFTGLTKDMENIAKVADYIPDRFNKAARAYRDFRTLTGRDNARINDDPYLYYQRPNQNSYMFRHSDMIPSLVHSDMEDIDNFLCHYGVLGMKWGVHKAKEHYKNLHYAEKKALKLGRSNRDLTDSEYKNMVKESKDQYKANIKKAKDYAKANKRTDKKVKDIEKLGLDEARKNIEDYDKINKSIRKKGAMAKVLGAAAVGAGAAAYGSTIKSKLDYANRYDKRQLDKHGFIGSNHSREVRKPENLLNPLTYFHNEEKYGGLQTHYDDSKSEIAGGLTRAGIALGIGSAAASASKAKAKTKLSKGYKGKYNKVINTNRMNNNDWTQERFNKLNENYKRNTGESLGSLDQYDDPLLLDILEQYHHN